MVRYSAYISPLAADFLPDYLGSHGVRRAAKYSLQLGAWTKTFFLSRYLVMV